MYYEPKTEIAVSIIAAMSVICFLSSMSGDFVYDDSEAIVNNPDVKQTTSIHELFHNDFWGTKLTRKESHKSYRPLTVLTFRLNMELTGGELIPFGFHVVNVLLHAVVSSLSLFVFQTLYGDKQNKFVSFLAAMLFAVHPIHTEAVAGVVGRADLLCTLFSFCALLTYAAGVKHLKSTLSNLLCALLVVVFSACAMFSKEQGITSIGICFVYDILIAHEIHPLHFHKWLKTNSISITKVSYTDRVQSGKKLNANRRLRLLFLRHIVLFLGGISLLVVRWYIMGSSSPVFQKVDNPASFVEDPFVKVLNYNYIYALNAWLLLCPIWLCCDWSMGCIPLLTGLTDYRVLVVIAFWIALFSIFAAGITAKNSVLGRNILMALAVIIISFLPASNLFFTVGFVVAERILYLPSTGFCMLVALGIHRLSKLYNCRNVLRVSFGILILMFSIYCSKRSLDWQNEHSLFLSALSVCPLNAKIHYNLGKTTSNQTLAVEHYREAIRLNPEYSQAMNNLANILKDQGNYEEAEALLRLALQLRPDFAAAWMNLGIVLSFVNNFSEAEKCYANALKYRKRYPDCYFNLGNLYVGQKMYKEAMDAWKQAISLKPTHKVAWNNMIIMLHSIGDFHKAIEVGKDALAVLPTDAAVHFSMGNAFGNLGQFEEAEMYFKTAIRLKPDHAIYFVNLGVLYHQWKKIDLAKAMYQEALKIDPMSKSARDNLAMLQ